MCSFFSALSTSYRYVSALIVEFAAGIFLVLTVGFWLPIALRLGGFILIIGFLFLALAAVADDTEKVNQIPSVIFLSQHPAHLSEHQIIQSTPTDVDATRSTKARPLSPIQSLNSENYQVYGNQGLRSPYDLSRNRSPCRGAKYETNDSDQALFDRCFKNRFRNLPRWYGSNNGYAGHFVSGFKDSWRDY